MSQENRNDEKLQYASKKSYPFFKIKPEQNLNKIETKSKQNQNKITKKSQKNHNKISTVLFCCDFVVF